MMMENEKATKLEAINVEVPIMHCNQDVIIEVQENKFKSCLKDLYIYYFLAFISSESKNVMFCLSPFLQTSNVDS